MCRSFEVISGKKNKGDKGLLKGLTKMYRDAKYSVAIIPIPVELLEIDTRYQTEVRTDRSLMYLVNNWDENKLLPLIGVPHWEEGKVYLVDGYGRWVASQMVDKEKYTDLQVLLILNAPNNAEERLEFEAEMYAYQNKQVARMTAIQKHGAMVVLHDKATERLEKLKEKYGFEYASCKAIEALLFWVHTLLRLIYVILMMARRQNLYSIYARVQDLTVNQTDIQQV